MPNRRKGRGETYGSRKKARDKGIEDISADTMSVIEQILARIDLDYAGTKKQHSSHFHSVTS